MRANDPRLLIAATTLILAACASDGPPIDRTTQCGLWVSAAEEGFRKEKYWDIKEDLEKVMDSCQGTGHVERGEFLLAESYFHLEEWVDARGEYGSFVLNFPSSPFAETAAYRKALASYNTAYSQGRDDGNTERALHDFDDFIASHPSSALLDSAREYSAMLRERLAEKEYLIARLYSRMDEPQAAAIYLRMLLEDYPRTVRRADAFDLIVRCYTKLEQFDQAERFLSQAVQELGPTFGPTADDLRKKLTSARVSSEDRIRRELKAKVQRKEDES